MKHLVTILYFLILNQALFAQSLAGSWSGDLHVPSGKLKFVIHLEQIGAMWTAKADSPDQGVYSIPSRVHLYQPDSIVVEVQGGIKYSGKLKDKHSIVGHFQQKGYQTDLVLTNAPKETRVRSQRINPPYAYDTLSVKFPNHRDQILLSGTLTYPKKTGKFPAVVLVSGSGPQDRNSTVFGHETFKVLADYLTKNNIIVLRYDDRGVGASEGDFNTSTIADFSQDALAALDFLKNDPRVDQQQIGLIGHSEGGLIAELLAGQQFPSISFIVSLAGPAVAIDELMVQQLYKIGKVGGLDEKQLAKGKEINKKNFSILKSDRSDQEAYRDLQENMKGIPGYSASLDNSVNQLLSPSFRYFMKIQPDRFLQKINVPVFAAFGGLDVQVDADQNIFGLQTNLKRHKDHKIMEYPSLNHLFQTASTGAVDEYAKIEETFSPQVMKDIVEWIHKITK